MNGAKVILLQNAKKKTFEKIQLWQLTNPTLQDRIILLQIVSFLIAGHTCTKTSVTGLHLFLLFVSAQNVGDHVVKCRDATGVEAESSIRPGSISLWLLQAVVDYFHSLNQTRLSLTT